MSFQEGYTNVSPVEQSIAFWAHTIDVYYDLFWFQGTTMGGRCAQVSELTTEITGIRSEHVYMGAIRAGFGHVIASLRTKCDSLFSDTSRTNWHRCALS